MPGRNYAQLPWRQLLLSQKTKILPLCKLQIYRVDRLKASLLFKLYIEIPIPSESGDRNPAFNNASLPLFPTLTAETMLDDNIHSMSSRRLLSMRAKCKIIYHKNS